MAEMTIAQLAETVSMTPRNIRAYQSRGLLEPPQIRGRVAYYSGVHAARLQLIASLQREGFTLTAIKRLVEEPSSYSAIVAERRRRFREGRSDIAATVPVSEERIRTLFPEMDMAELARTGLVWRDATGELVSSPVVVGVGRMLLRLGVPAETVMRLMLDAVRSGREIGGRLRGHLATVAHGERDIARVAVQLSAAAFELGFLSAATDPPADKDKDDGEENVDLDAQQGDRVRSA